MTGTIYDLLAEASRQIKGFRYKYSDISSALYIGDMKIFDTTGNLTNQYTSTYLSGLLTGIQYSSVQIQQTLDRIKDKY